MGAGQYVKMGRVPVGGDAPHKDTAIYKKKRKAQTRRVGGNERRGKREDW